MTQDTDAVILNAIKYGDTSKIVTAFTRSNGKIGLLAKGARMPKSKFGSALEPLSVSEISFYYKSTRDLQILTKSEQKFRINKIYSDNDHFACGLILLETVNQTNEVAHVNEELYDMISGAIEGLKDCTGSPFDELARFFLLYCDLLGFSASFGDSGVFSDSRYAYVSVADSRLLASKAASAFAFRMDRSAYDKLSALNVNIELNPEFDKNEGIEIIEFFSRYLSYHFDKRIRFKSQSLLLNENHNA